jgi:tRNA nucleotidyltransferase (CCA-adding enzyme)
MTTLITAHQSTDFDALASVVAAKKIYPDSIASISGSLNQNVRDFYQMHIDLLELIEPESVDQNSIDTLIIVDTRIPDRLGIFSGIARKETINKIIYDHHPKSSDDLKGAYIDRSKAYGATTTILVKELITRKISIDHMEATLFALGVHEDTGSLTYLTSTSHDAAVLAFLISKGANIAVINRFLSTALTPDQHALLELLLHSLTRVKIKDKNIIFADAVVDEFVDGLSVLAYKLLDIEECDVGFIYVKMGDRIQLVARSKTTEVDVLKVIEPFGGGGHPQAASAVLKDKSFNLIKAEVCKRLEIALAPRKVARDIMSYPVKFISEDSTVLESSDMMSKLGHTGLPVLSKGQIVGVITRKDADKAIRHGLQHAPVRGFISKKLVKASPGTDIYELQRLMIQNSIGRIPIVDGKRVVGIVTRKDLLRALHGDQYLNQKIILNEKATGKSIAELIKEYFRSEVYDAVKEIGKIANRLNMKAYLVGGIVRDIFLHVENFDIDIVIEGDGIQLALEASQHFKCPYKVHSKFGTATLYLNAGFNLDIATSRMEYYEKPATLPLVVKSNIRQDLYRRDFTINTMAISLNSDSWGKLLDYFGGMEDVINGRIRILHSMSFIEDPTRIFRAIRFEQRLGFGMEENTEQKLKEALVLGIPYKLSPVRLRDEILNMLNERNPWKSFQRLDDLGGIKYISPSFVINKDVQFAMKRGNKSFDRLSKKFNLKTKRWLVLLSEMVILSNFKNADDVTNWGRGIGLTNKSVSAMVEVFNKITSIREILSSSDLKDFELFDTFSVLRDDSIVIVHSLDSKSAISVERYLRMLSSIKVEINGNDIIKLGVEPGEKIKELLRRLTILKVKGILKNRDDEMEYAKTYLKEN